MRAKRSGKGTGGLSDEVGLGDPGKERLKRSDAALFRQTACNPVDARKARQRGRSRFSIGCLGIIDKNHAALARNRLHAVLQAGKRLQAVADRFRADTGAQCRCNRCRRILGVVGAAQGRDAVKIGKQRDLPVAGLHEPRPLGIDAVIDRPGSGNALHGDASRFRALRNRPAPVIIDTGYGKISTGNQLFLDRCIMFHRAMPVEVIGCEVEQNARRGIK